SFVLHVSIDGEAGLLCEAPAVIYVGMVFQPGSAMVPVIDGENAGSVPLQDLPLAPKTVLGEVAESPDVGTAEESGVGLEILGGVLVHAVEFQFRRTALQVGPVCWSAFVRTVVQLGMRDHSL